MTDKVQKIRNEVEKLKSNLMYGACSSQVAMETRCKEEAYNEVLSIMDSMQEKPKQCMYSKGNYTDEDRKVLCDGCGEECEFKIEIPFGANNSELEEATYHIPSGFHAIIDGDSIVIRKGKEPVSEDLEKEINEYISILTERRGDFPKLTKLGFRTIARHFANWQKQAVCRVSEDSKAEQICKEVLKRYKAQKGEEV